MPSPKELAKALAYQGEIRNTSRNRLLGGVADVLSPVSEFADQYKISDRIPFLGGMSAADLTGLKGAQSLVNDMSYGKSPISGASLQTTKVDPRVLDLAGVSGAMMPAGKALGKAALREGARQVQNRTGIARYMLDTRMGVVPEGKAMSVPAKAMNDGSQDVITYIGRKGQKFQITKQRDNELLDIHSSIADKAREIFGDGVEIFDSGMSSSRYVRLPNGSKIRVSDHPLPSDFAAIHGVPDIEVRGGQDLQKAIDYMTDVKSNNTMPNSQKRYDDLSLREELRSNGVPLFSVDAKQIKKLVSSGVGYDDIASQLQQKYPKLTDADAAKIYTVIGRGKFDKFDVPVKDQIVRYGDNVGGAMMQRPKTEFEILHDTAQRNAALPVKQGGLGLPSNNTYIDRANVMYPTDVYHGSNLPIEQIDPAMLGSSTGAKSAKQAFWVVDNPTVARGYAEYAANEAPVAKILKDAEFQGKVAQRTGNWDKYESLVTKAEELESANQANPLNGQNIMPLRINTNNSSVMDAGGNSFPYAENDINQFLRQSKYAGNDVAQIKNLDDAVGRVDLPANHYAVFNPANIRSRFAAFDPMRRHEADILAGVGVGGMLDPQAIAEALRQQDRK